MLQPSLTDTTYLKHVLEKAGALPKKSMGQNFLVCDEVLEATTATLASHARSVTELGAGLGTLTQAMLGAGFRVRAIEKDDTLVSILKKHAPDAEIVHGDIKSTPWEWADGYQIAGNIPYNISGLIIRRLTQLNPSPQQALLLMQAEVATRILADPQHMSLLALAVQLWGKADRLLTVPPSCFWPQPSVSSTLVVFQPHEPSTAIDVSTREEILQLAKICFQNKRKQIAGSLRRLNTYSDDTIAHALETADIAPDTRPQAIAVEQWKILCNTLT